MSRSRKKNSFIGNTCAESDKWWKESCHRRIRHHARQLLHLFEELDFEDEELFDKWTSAKDGKHRFDIKDYPELMRK